MREKAQRLCFTVSVYRLSSITRPDASEAEWLTTSASQFPVENPEVFFFTIIILKLQNVKETLSGNPANKMWKSGQSNYSSFLL